MKLSERLARTARGEKVPPVRDYSYAGKGGEAENIFELMEAAAAAGARAPMNDTLPAPGGWGLRVLLATGRIRIEIYALNWRVVEIMTGPHAGKRTQECPRGGKMYKVLP